MSQSTVSADNQATEAVPVKADKMTADDYKWQVQKNLLFSLQSFVTLVISVGVCTYMVILINNHTRNPSPFVAYILVILSIIGAIYFLFNASMYFGSYRTSLIDYKIVRYLELTSREQVDPSGPELLENS